jgi:hypothetical protein
VKEIRGESSEREKGRYIKKERIRERDKER